MCSILFETCSVPHDTVVFRCRRKYSESLYSGLTKCGAETGILTTLVSCSQSHNRITHRYRYIPTRSVVNLRPIIKAYSGISTKMRKLRELRLKCAKCTRIRRVDCICLHFFEEKVLASQPHERCQVVLVISLY